MTRPPRLRRSCHSVPGGSERMLERARELPADLVFMDLEDSVPPDAKSDARARVAEVLAARSHHAPTVGVRVNPVGGPHCHLDLAAVVGGRADSSTWSSSPRSRTPGTSRSPTTC